MNRREFLFRIGGTMVAVPMVLEAISCADDKAIGPNGTDWTQTSSTNSGHTHTILFVCAGLATHAGTPYVSSTVGSHSHDLTLDINELNTIISGGSITKVSTVNDGHPHTWTIQTPAGTC